MTRRKYSTEVIAHRGFSGRAPENTPAAFRLALESRADRVEFDVLLTRDGVPVVIHDALLDRTTNGRGLVAEMDLSAIRALDAGSWFDPRFAGERVPTLDETLALCSDRIAVNVEIKEEAVVPGTCRPESIESRVIEALRRYGLLGSAVVSSFDLLSTQRIRQLEPSLACEILFNRPGGFPTLSDLEAVKSGGFRGLSLSTDELRGWPEVVARAHELGLGVKVYTVDDPTEMAMLLDLGVDGIFTNRPDLLASLVHPTV